MVIKLDLEKAYDRVSWVFLEQTLEFFGVPQNLSKLILHCVKCAKPRILWNGEPLEAIEPNCGLRQGDPLSPYLFVLCIERLSYMIGEYVGKKKWQPLSPCRGGPRLSHLFFADDLLLMAKASTKNARNIRRVLDDFCGSSGLKISYNKSKVFFAKGGEGRVKRVITSILGFGRTSNLGRYLGVPLIHERVSPRLFWEVIDRVAGRLSAWKAKLLSLAGRATLIKAVTSAIPNHVMQTTWLPSSTCDQLDKLNRSFLWSSDASRRKLHLVGWHKVTKCKILGGLGLKQARKTNVALLAKVGWKTINGENDVWGSTFRKKYLGSSDLFGYKIKPGDSYTWKGVVRSMNEVGSCIKWRLGDGKTISLWHDFWVGDEPLANKMEHGIHEEELNWRVSEIIDANGAWNRSRMKSDIPNEVWNDISSLPIPLSRDHKDTRVWGGTSNGLFSCKSAYTSLMREDVNVNGENQDWNWVWKFNCSERIRLFIWTCLHNSLPTNSLRFRRRLTSSDFCQRCMVRTETIIHALRDCSLAKEVWEFVIAPTQFLKFTHLNPDTWLKDNITKERFDNIILPNVPWHTLFVAIVWSIWKSRNKFIFQNIRDSVRQVVFAARNLADDLSKISTKTGHRLRLIHDPVKWVKPKPGWHKLNTDGSVLVSRKSAAAGGLLRDESGDWIVGFSRHLGDVSITLAELLAAREGLVLAWERRIQKIELELDSEVVVNLLKDAEVESHSFGRIIEDCRTLLRKPWESRVVHTRRSGNSCADALAKLGHDDQIGSRIWDTAPREVVSLLLEDVM